MTTSNVTFEALASVPGWFERADFDLFSWFLEDQNERGITGDLAELGTYLGKSAILIGAYQRPGEVFTALDLFEMGASDSDNQSENARSYAGISQAAFERNYLRFHPELPTVVKGLSSVILDHARPGQNRFIHIDASHLYEHVRQDIAAAQTLLQSDSVVVFDDYRSPHTPGTAAAVWEAVVNDGLNPVVVTSSKLYGTWSDPDPLRKRLISSLDRDQRWEYEVQVVAGHELVRLAESYREPLQARVFNALVPMRLRPVVLRTLRR